MTVKTKHARGTTSIQLSVLSVPPPSLLTASQARLGALSGTHPLWTGTSCRPGSRVPSPASNAGCRRSSECRRSTRCTRWLRTPPASRSPPRAGRIRLRGGRACPPGPPPQSQKPATGRGAACTRPRSAARRCPHAPLYTRCQPPGHPCTRLLAGEHLSAPSEDPQPAAPSGKLRWTADCLHRWSPCCVVWRRVYCGLLAYMHEI